MFENVFAFAKIIASSIASTTSATLYNVTGVGGFSGKVDDDDAGEQATGQENFQSLGVIARPRAPSLLGDALAWAEALAARTSDGLVSLAYRDLRLHKRFPNPKEGTIAMVGYGGAFLSFDDTDGNSGDEKASKATLYVPYQWSGGTPAKAFLIAVDPTTGNETIVMLHGEGHGVILDKAKNVIMKNAAGDAYFQTGTSGNVINGNTVINGGATIGSPAGALPAAKATPIQTYLTALEALLATLAANLDAVAGGGANAGAVTTFTGAQAATKVAIAATKTSIA